MKRQGHRSLCLGLIALGALLAAHPARGGMAMGTAFTYQGQLNRDGAPFQGTADLEFTLWDDDAAGTQVGPILSKPGQAVANGLFTVALDFEQGAFNGTARWLEIRARAGGGAFETLTPRQPLTPTPYSLVAAGLRLPIAAAADSATPALDITNNGTGSGLVARHASTGNVGTLGGPEDGVYGESSVDSGVSGESITGCGVSGDSASGIGIFGLSVSNLAVHGENEQTGNYGQLGGPMWGVKGGHSSGTEGYLGGADAAVTGHGNGQNAGWFNGRVEINGDLAVFNGLVSSDDATFADAQVVQLTVNSLSGGNATLAEVTVNNDLTGNRAEFTGSVIVGDNFTALRADFAGRVGVGGDLNVTGDISKGGGTFKIDHPLDPANKYLYHSFVESPDMMNVYNGNVALDAKGEAWVEMPKWFEALNRDFRYQLTPIGGPGPSLHIAQEIQDRRFRIAGGSPGLKVSWQVTGIRQDPYANAHRIRVEVDKAPAERGYFLHPEAYGLPAEAGMGHIRRPQVSALAGAARKGGAR